MIGSEEAFLDLIAKNQRIIHNVCRMYTDVEDDHKDLFQEILAQLWKGYPNFKGDAKVSTWMYRVSLYTAISNLKKVIKSREVSTNLEVALSYEQKTFESEIDTLHLAINKLEDGDKAIVLLYLEEKSYKEMAVILGITETNVGVKLSRIKKKLKSLIK